MEPAYASQRLPSDLIIEIFKFTRRSDQRICFRLSKNIATRARGHLTNWLDYKLYNLMCQAYYIQVRWRLHLRDAAIPYAQDYGIRRKEFDEMKKDFYDPRPGETPRYVRYAPEDPEELVPVPNPEIANNELILARGRCRFARKLQKIDRDVDIPTRYVIPGIVVWKPLVLKISYLLGRKGRTADWQRLTKIMEKFYWPPTPAYNEMGISAPMQDYLAEFLTGLLIVRNEVHDQQFFEIAGSSPRGWQAFMSKICVAAANRADLMSYPLVKEIRDPQMLFKWAVFNHAHEVVKYLVAPRFMKRELSLAADWLNGYELPGALLPHNWWSLPQLRAHFQEPIEAQDAIETLSRLRYYIYSNYTQGCHAPYSSHARQIITMVLRALVREKLRIDPVHWIYTLWLPINLVGFVRWARRLGYNLYEGASDAILRELIDFNIARTYGAYYPNVTLLINAGSNAGETCSRLLKKWGEMLQKDKKWYWYGSAPLNSFYVVKYELPRTLWWL